MATFNKFNHFMVDVVGGVHVNALNADTDVLKVYLSNAAPNAASHTIKANVAEISATGSYPAGGTDAQNAATNTTGVITVAGTDITFTASGGSIGPFQYAVLYNDTPGSPVDPLIGWWDYGTPVTLQDGESFKVDFGASMFSVG